MRLNARRLAARPLLGSALLLALAGCGMPMKDIAAENRAVHWSGNVAACDDGGVLSSITGRFASAEAGLAGEGRSIEQLDGVRQVGFRKNGPAFIPRRDCVATARLDDRSVRKVYYTVVANVGTYSLADKVEFCVEGHDHYHLGQGACTRMSR